LGEDPCLDIPVLCSCNIVLSWNEVKNMYGKKIRFV
jgi:hypothetical protein